MSVQAAFEPWQVSATRYPGNDAGHEEQLRFMLSYAILAPSSNNTQPWLFRFHGARVGVYLDRSRALPVADHPDRELTISCGAAIFNLCCTIKHFGFKAVGELLPDPARPDLLALMGLGERTNPDHECNSLFTQIPLRRTNRMPFEKRSPDKIFIERLDQLARGDGAWIHVVHGRQMRHAVAELVAEGDRFQWHDARYRQELAHWIHSNRSESHDGMPGYSFGHGDLQSLLDPFLIRTFDRAEKIAAADLDMAENSPALMVLGTPEDTPRDWLHAGRALQHILLTAAAGGLSASFFNQPIQVQTLRPRLAQAISRTGYPQLVLRMGFGPEVRPTPRRSVGEVVRGPV